MYIYLCILVATTSWVFGEFRFIPHLISRHFHATSDWTMTICDPHGKLRPNSSGYRQTVHFTHFYDCKEIELRFIVGSIIVGSMTQQLKKDPTIKEGPNNKLINLLLTRQLTKFKTIYIYIYII